MCGRINIIDAEHMRVFFEGMGIKLSSNIDAPRYNIAPSAYIPVVARQDNKLVCSNMGWGLTPKWMNPGQLLINARSETIQEKPSFKRLFESQRAVIPATGFYEWRRDGKAKKPFHFVPSNTDLFLMAGIWSSTTNCI